MNVQLPVELTFTVSERESLALAEQYYRDSPLHQRVRRRNRWSLPLLLLPIAALFVLQFGFAIVPMTIFVLGAVTWVILAPMVFDVRVRRLAKQRLRDASYSKSFGTYHVRIEKEHFVSDGPTGHTEHNWHAVDRAILTEEFLFIFLSGPYGIAVSVEQVGMERAKLAHDAVQQAISEAT